MPNRLAAEKSPYLRQHADNPVDWFPWGEEALARARTEQKPIFLSIGYSTCHWCHVMAHESFENAAVAAVLNRDFVPVKLDREERPDLDRVYMTYVQHTTGHGGWPMSVWLTPGLKPFYGGTYFPPDDRPGRPGFVTMLKTITRHWREQRLKIETGADEVVEALRHHAMEGGRHAAPGESGHVPTLSEAAREALTKAVQYFHGAHDATWGGFSGAPKFPHPAVLNFLFRLAALQGQKSNLGVELVKMASFTLRKMSEGGMHDHAGGGFHRYSVDEQWFVPHFEKMLYDQAQLAVSYLEARQATGHEVYAWIARGIFDYARRDLMHPQGAFYSAEDADSLVAQGKPEHAEGAFYVWTKAEIDAVLSTDSAFFCAHYGVKAGGNVAHDPQSEFTGKNILRQLQSLSATARAFESELEPASDRLLGCLEKLRMARTRRPRPHLDDKIITAWNGLMISALAKGHQILGGMPPSARKPRGEVAAAPDYLATATRGAEFIARELYDANNCMLYRSWREGRSTIVGFAEDYAFMIQGLLDLYETGFEIRWLQWAVKLQAKMNELFWDTERGGYFNSRADDPTVIVRMKEEHDGAEPAANSIAALNLLRLDWMLGVPGARERALKTLEALRPQWTSHPAGLPQLLCAIELVLDAPRTVVLAGDPAAEDFQALVAVLHGKLGPRRALLAADGGEGQCWLAAHRPYLAEMKPIDGRATAYVCENYACQASVSSPADLQALLNA
ncbi:MAG: thioredoxin domain-containing protein [Lacunisphaera sp.]|nr:thioredoxin domain-containing protein [Lacunisphaera sp.]